jgi:asparagine synthase (glutamine-hydrolysing)
MCGIAGIVAPEATRYTTHVKAMMDCIAHRGPDGEGVQFFGNCALGHRRLSIVDMVTGHQPMLSPDGDNGIVFNGEIYGYREIRAKLPDYTFKTSSDTEVILALFREYGKGFLDRLPGMFAFALWDEVEQELICARDRFGEKPFYFALGEDGEFLFASEIKAIIASGLVTPELDSQALSHYLKYLYVHPSQTIYRNIHTLLPGHELRFRNGAISVRRYWELPAVNDSIALGDAVEEFRSLLDKSVTRQLVADVPVGAFLSGGLDSSTIVALAAGREARLKTFSFDFEAVTGELAFARDVADMYGTEHTELSDTQYDIAGLLLTMQEVYDEPFGDSSNIPTYLISKLARQHVKVVLTGDGGDELFGGYAWYRSLYHMKGRSIGAAFTLPLLRCALKVGELYGMPCDSPWRYYVHGMKFSQQYATVSAAHEAQMSFFTDQELAGAGLPPVVNYHGTSSSGTVDTAIRMDVIDYMPGDILVKIDRASMSNGLELRAPFLDKDFAEFCLSLPYRLKLDGRTDKIILREACASYWPSSVRKRGKLGFGAPVSRWLGLPSVQDLKNQFLNNPSSKIFSIIPYKKCTGLTVRDDYRTWALLVLALWLEKHRSGGYARAVNG